MARKKVALVLSGGNAYGFAHVGVLTILERFKIPIDAVFGASMGALVGGIYAAGKLKDFRKKILSMDKKETYRLFVAKPSAFGIVHHAKIERFLKDFIKDIKIQNLKKKYACIALDLVSGKEVILKKGELLKAISASTCIPGFFVPIMKGKKIMVDVGCFDPMPVNLAKEICPDHFIIAVNVIQKKEGIVKPGKIPNIFNTFHRMIQLAEEILTKNIGKGADIIIKPKIGIGNFQYHLAEKAIMAGEEAALLAVPHIKNKLGLI